MAPPRNGGVQHALLVVSSVRETVATGSAELGRKVFMVERAQLLEAAEAEEWQKMMGKTLDIRRHKKR